MEGLGGYGSDSDSDDADTSAAALAVATTAMQEDAAASSGSGSDDDDDDSSDDGSSDDSDDDQPRQKQPSVKFASAGALFSSGTKEGSVFHNPYEKQDIHSKRKLEDGEAVTLFKKVERKKFVKGQGRKPIANSSVAGGWTGQHVIPPQVARGRANHVTEDTAAWTSTSAQRITTKYKEKKPPPGMYEKLKANGAF